MRRISQTSVTMLLAAGLFAPACGKEKAGTNAPAATGEAVAQQETAANNAKAEGLIEVANRDLASGRHNSARARAEEALEANPNNVDAHSILGASYRRAGEFDKSLESYRAATEIEPSNFGAVIGLTANLQAVGRHEDTIAAIDRLIETEGKGFVEKPCDAEGQCDAGYCEPESKVCKADMQVRPRITKLLSQYLLLDADGASKTADEIFVGVGGDEFQLNVARALASFVRPLEGKGPFLELEGAEGSTELGVHAGLAVKYARVELAGKGTVAVISEMQDECRIDAAFAEGLGLEEVGKAKPLGMEEELPVVIVPELKFGELTVRNVPAMVQDLSMYGEIGDTPGAIVGRQVLHKLGQITYDFPGSTMTVAPARPTAAPEGTQELPLLMMDMLGTRVPVVKMGIDGGKYPYWAWLGGAYASGVTVTAKEYLRANHQPADIAEPEDAEAGLKMVYVRSLNFGDLELPGVGGIVLTNSPPDDGLANVVSMTSFELGGYLNMTLLKQWKVTYALQDGKLYLANPAAAEAAPAG